MRTLYSAFIQLLGWAFRLASLFGNEKAKKWVEGRKNLFQELQSSIPSDRALIWFHCASLGEFEQARPLLERIAKAKSHFILLTFFSPSGFESKRHYEHADLVSYMPVDSKSNADKFLDIIKPELSFFAKYEFWFNHLKALEDRNLKHYLISGIFRPKQQFFRFYGKWFRDHLKAFTHLFLQDEASVRLLKSFGIEHCSLSGDGRFDRVWEISQQKVNLPLIDSFVNGHFCIVFGSSWEKENLLAFQLAQRHPDVKVILAPHEFHKQELEKLESRFDRQVSYYSKGTDALSNNQILVIDQMGLLSKIYRYGNLAVIGGGFGKGIHNILEAAVYGIPVMFGPNYDFFNEAKELISKGAAKVFKNEEQFHLLVEQYIHKSDLRLEARAICRQYFKENIGATQLIFSKLTNQNSL